MLNDSDNVILSKLIISNLSLLGFLVYVLIGEIMVIKLYKYKHNRKKIII